MSAAASLPPGLSKSSHQIELEHRDNNPGADPRAAAQLDLEKRKRKQLQEEVSSDPNSRWSRLCTLLDS